MEKVWLVRPFPHDVDRFTDFRNGQIIAIGWPEVPSLKGRDKNEIRSLLKNHPKKYSPSQLGAATSTVNTFVNGFSQGDRVLIPYEDEVFIGEIESDYFFEPTKVNEGYPHQRRIKWLKGPISRSDLPDEVRNSLRAPRTVADLSEHSLAIKMLLSNDPQPMTRERHELMEVSYPLRTDLNCIVKIPKDITREEASRLSEFVKTLYFS